MSKNNTRLLRPLPRGFVLQNGNHNYFERGACVMEAAAYVSGEPHSDQPECVSTILTSIAIELNDNLPNEDRHLLLPLIPLLVDTSDSLATDRKRGFAFLDVMIREVIPEILKRTRMTNLIGVEVVVQTLSRLGPIENRYGAVSARAACRRLQDNYLRSGSYLVLELVQRLEETLVMFQKGHVEHLSSACCQVSNTALSLANGSKDSRKVYQMVVDGFERVITAFPGKFLA